MRLYTLTTLFLFLTIPFLHTQETHGNCKADSLIDIGFPCPQTVEPVCGCDGVTYQNECYAVRYGGLTEWTPGPCDPSCVDSSQIDPNIVCPAIYDPVCGCNGVTYGNACSATYSGGVTSYTAGVCSYLCVDSMQINPNHPCPDNYDPVCGCDGITYANECDAYYHGGVIDWTDGECVSACIDSAQIDINQACPDHYDPVCGCNGVTYANECYAYYYGGVTSWSDGACDTVCVDSSQIDINQACPDHYDPVCGCNGVTYANECYAYYYGGVTSWTDGACDTICVDSSQIDPNQACPDNYDPVCGCNGVTYANECYAHYYGGVTSWTDGACDTICVDSSQIDINQACPDHFDPVCGCNGVTYANECYAHYYGGVTSWTDGECDTVCVDSSQIDTDYNCPLYFDPVCGCNGVLYGNECEAYYYGGVTSWTDGPCPDSCTNPAQIDSAMNCPAIYDPVCGCDSVTYSNECVAYYYGGVTSWTDGECDFPTNVPGETSSFNVLLYPNPVQNNLRIDIQSPNEAYFTIDIYNMVGQRIIDRRALGYEIQQQINTSSWSTGSYYARITSEYGRTEIIYFVKQ